MRPTFDAAAKAAHEAFADWSGRSGKERKKDLHRVADLIEMRADDIAAVECVDTGQTVRFMSAAAIRGAENFRFFADHAPDANNGRSMPDEHHVNFSSRRALGPVGVITPWNTPFMLSTWKIAPALAAGCTVVHKPAEWSPYTAAMLSEIAVEAGLPPGVLNTVHGFGESAGKALTEHPLIKAIAFVGESSTGSMIQAQGAPDAQASALRTRWQEPSDRVRRRRSRSGTRRRDLHDLQLERRAMHVIESAADPVIDSRRVRGRAD